MKSRFFLIELGLSGLFFVMIGCQEPSSLELLWSVRRGLVGNWGVHGDEVYTVGRKLSVYSLSTGQELRTVRLPQDYGNTTLGKISPELAITPSSLVFGWYDFKGELKEQEGNIFCYDPHTLQLRWQRSLPLRKDALVAPTFSMVIDGSYLYVLGIGKVGQNLFKLRMSDGQIVWSATIEKYVNGVPLVFNDGILLARSTVSITHPNQYEYFQAISPDTGKILWRIRIDGLSVFDDPPLISGDHAYLTSEAVLSNPDHFYTADLKKGIIVDHQRVRQLRAPFAEHAGVLYFGGSTPAAFNISRKQIVWQSDLRGPGGIGEPFNANGLLDPIRREIYIGDWNRNLYVLSSTTGQVKEKVNIRGYWRGDFLFSPLKAFFGSYGVKKLKLTKQLLLVGTVDSSLFVFRRTEKN